MALGQLNILIEAVIQLLRQGYLEGDATACKSTERVIG